VLESVPMAYQPAGTEVLRSYKFDQLLAVMRRQFPDAPLPADALLFETGDTSEYGYPFVYVSPDREQIVFLQRPGRDGRVWSGLPFGSTLGVLARTVMDHIRIMLNQPVSSVARLFTLVASSTADLVQPAPLALLQDQPVPPLQAVPGMDLQAWEASLDALTGTTASSGRLRYHVDGAGFFPRFMNLVNGARESVYLRVYIFDNDDYALQVADLLARKSAAVDVKVLVDGLGTLGAGQTQSPTLPPGHEPPLSIVRYLENDSAVQVRTVPNPWLTGDHTKAIIVDGRIAFVGGMNIGREYRYDWHDLMVEVDGPVVERISADFEQAWISAGMLGDLRRLFHVRSGEAAAERPDDYPLRLLYTRPGDSQILRAQIAAIRTARQRIFLQNPYLTSDAILYELVKARRRGVDVRVILPYRSDSGLITRSNALVANAMLRNGIRVYIYPGMSHLKAAVYDGWACLGSANFDNLSLRVNREMNLATAHPPAVDALLAQVFHPDFEVAVELTGPLPNNWLHYLSELLADPL
jgi:cardiolipin synthase